ncbi:hypothetical protein L211DRAFT_886029 [Terfezia boudieri ATCC MYA-4762]|uniref:SEC7 domain-containing protein n=1 Tax=Terfezia boudieri ATCC MYA-4762 TaxID=1051890 RepID=A0A3N4LGH7_9PEZI|nr:hypothetical protein L211DRAFT_886029 [Terfezia boudieri ATCC MYA-4762]
MPFDTEKPTLDLKEENWARLNVGSRNGVEAGAPSRSLQPSPDLRDRDLPPIPPSDYARSEMGESVGAGNLEDAPPPPIPQKDSPKATTSSSRGPSRGASSTPTNISVASSKNPANGQSTFNSMVFVIQALETISTSKEGRRRKYLSTACQEALDAIKAAAPQLPPDPQVVFEPLKIACETHNIQITTTALDTIGKLISYSYFSAVPVEAGTPPSSADDGAEAGRRGQLQQQQKIPLIERAIETICECFQGDGTADQVQLQIIKALLAAVLNDKAVVHGAGLIKAIRQTYNIFLLSKSSPNQMTAQGTLTQMVHTVFERVKSRVAMKETQLRSSSKANMSSATINIPTPGGGECDEALSTAGCDGEESTGGRTEASDERQATPVEKITLQSFENRKSFDDGRIADTTTVTRSSSVTRSHKIHERSEHTDGTDSQAGSETEDEDEVFIKDAFVVFRSMCKLSDKSISADQMADIKSNGMRSKLLSLHLIHTILKSHMTVFTNPLVTIRSSSKNEPTRFIHAVKQYLCLSLSRNAASAAGLVFEVCCEIFWLVLREMRVMMKKEIEVFLKEIYLAILDNKNSGAQQKQYLLGVLERLCLDPRALVEIYLNYDCDRSALDNIFQRIIEHLSRIAITPVHITEQQQQAFRDYQAKLPASTKHEFSLPPSLSTASISSPYNSSESPFPVEYGPKHQSLACLVGVLHSLITWSQKGMADAAAAIEEAGVRSMDEVRESIDFSAPQSQSYIASPRAVTPSGGAATPDPSAERRYTMENGAPGPVDDPSELERAKQRKTAMIEGIRQFNYKPKRGLKTLTDQGFIKGNAPEDVAMFLLYTEQLSKAMIGEYLGEGDPANVAIMHAFVDLMDFSKMRFVDALRRFLQSFRLPGEAQKIDRFMLKFAERYITDNPNAFANADTAYVLAYSVIMLNTDLHSIKLKGRPRMTKQEFIKNNRGINDNKDLPEEYLGKIYDEIQSNEIVLEQERDAATMQALAQQQTTGIAANIGQALATVGRDLQKEAYVQASEEMANKTEQLFKTLLRAQRRNSSRPALQKYIPASSFKHVGPMFEVTWMSFLSGLSGAAQDSNDLDTIKACMEGFKLAIKIACLFDLETTRIAFVTALAKFTHLNNLSEMKAKNMEALKVLLDVAQTEGNLLKNSWNDVLTCISQLERFQLISAGVDEGSVPDVTKSRYISQDGNDPRSRSSMQSTRPIRPPRARVTSSTNYAADVAEESRSREVVIAVDKIFANTANLSGEAIVYFVRALSEVSWQEIQSSGQSEHPRMFSLQKLVEISYYNMSRIRVEWSNIWTILGEHFNMVGCHSNTSVVFFALDSLRQLSMRFLEIEELPHFKFQKDFLRPFEHVMANSSVVPVKDMVLRCLNQMFQARGDNIRSGWRTMFGVFTVAAKEGYDAIVNLAFENVRKIYRERFGVIVQQGAFADMLVCITEFAKNQRFQKVSLQAIETLKAAVPNMVSCPETMLSPNPDELSDIPITEKVAPVAPTTKMSRMDLHVKYWFPVLFAFHDILMTGEDLEARTRALGYLFDTLVTYGGEFPTEFWDMVCRELLFPIFMVLKTRSEFGHFRNDEAQTMWLSTTMIQALRNLIALFTHYFDLLERMLDGFLDLLVTCICQENDTIARIGSSCLQQLILQSVKKLRPEHWSKIVTSFVQLFESTTADQLFSAATSGSKGPTSESQRKPYDADDSGDGENSLQINGLAPPILDTNGPDEISKEHSPDEKRQTVTNIDLEDYKPVSQLQQQPVVTAARRRFFNKIITKCVLQLLMIETVSELFSNDSVYNEIPSKELLRLMGLLKKSFSFARKFNADKELRMRLWREGFMKQPPNLLKQESGSAATYISILFRMYHDDKVERRQSRDAVEAALIPLCVDIICGYVILDEDTQQRNIVAWRPVVVDVMEGYTNFPEADFDKHIDTFYPLAVDVLNRELGHDVRVALQNLLKRIGEVKGMGMGARGRERRRALSMGLAAGKPTTRAVKEEKVEGSGKEGSGRREADL